MAIPPATETTDAVPAAITLDAMTSGAGIGISPKNGKLKVAIPSTVDKVSLVTGKFVGIGGGCTPVTSSVEDDASSEGDA